MSSFHLLPIIWTVVATGQAGSSSFVSLAVPPIVLFRMLHSYYSVLFVFFQVVTFLCLSNRIVRTCRRDHRAVSSYFDFGREQGNL